MRINRQTAIEGAEKSRRKDKRGKLWHFNSYLLTNAAATLCWIYLFLLNRTKVVGKRNVSREPNTLLLSNHQSPLDSFLIGIAAYYPRSLFRPRLLPWNPAAVEYFYKNKFTAWVAEHWKCIPVREGRRDPWALRRMIQVLPPSIMILFPEGRRSQGSPVGPGQPGAGFLTLCTRPKLIPVAIDGMHYVCPDRRFPFCLGRRLYISFGKQVSYSDLAEHPFTRQTAQLIVYRVMDIIQDQHAELLRLRAKASSS